jgi:hypothetical protein
VIVDVSSNPWRGSVSNVIIQLCFELERGARPRFPLVIERAKQRSPVDGRERAFTTYTAGSVAVAVGAVDGVTVMIRGRASRLRTIALGHLELGELDDALRSR